MNFQKNIQTIPNLPTVVNVKKAELAKRGIADALEWSSHENHVYIGRAMRFVKGVDQTSRWANPFSVERYGRTRCLEMYYEYAKVHLWDALEELASQGNSLLVVEHDEETMRRASRIIDLGPQAGTHGGMQMDQGHPVVRDKR